MSRTCWATNDLLAGLGLAWFGLRLVWTWRAREARKRGRIAFAVWNPRIARNTPLRQETKRVND